MTITDQNQVVISSTTGDCSDVVIEGSQYRSLDYYTTDQHLYVEDFNIFYHDKSSKRHFCRRATRDVQRAVRARGIDLQYALDTRLPTAIEVDITAPVDAPLALPTGAKITEGCPDNPGQLIFLLSGALTVPAGETRRAIAVSVDFGELYTDVAVREIVLEDYPQGTVALHSIEVVGCDHPLTLAATYRALALVMLDYMRETGDQFDAKYKIYQSYYMNELDRAMELGFLEDADKDGKPDSTYVKYASRRLLRS